MSNYRVEYADGEVQYYQFDAEDENQGGKAGLDALKDAAKSDESNVVKVTKADPKPGELVADDVQNA